jgi:hypothetical protein
MQFQLFEMSRPMRVQIQSGLLQRWLITGRRSNCLLPFGGSEIIGTVPLVGTKGVDMLSVTHDWRNEIVGGLFGAVGTASFESASSAGAIFQTRVPFTRSHCSQWSKS